MSRRRTISDFEFGDSKEHIEMCLNCVFPFCVNCLGSMRTVFDDVRTPAKNVRPRYDKKLTNRDMKVVMVYADSFSDKDISRKTGLSGHAVARARYKLGLPPIRKLTFLERKEIVAPWLEK